VVVWGALTLTSNRLSVSGKVSTKHIIIVDGGFFLLDESVGSNENSHHDVFYAHALSHDVLYHVP
jgi:hypothetical protein